ncbi:efflux RND transporter periplasmic adaptor subunit [Candidatus Caldatribacterium sp.]|uniref:efflux RND transporter periplasmic adaptor subunit n=1 Tax=Candidatus Caldatribacterium sp. TaxID=2282143 RepID=UPI00299498AE|nr:efflux RND transporter periplasmic adaptor subunit [Candidatus Caldatribacterium sp.]MDW8081025.1 efflux RND transporter periplasmic adaptor subunit [Candidatus Calescibacterium sp.]
MRKSLLTGIVGMLCVLCIFGGCVPPRQESFSTKPQAGSSQTVLVRRGKIADTISELGTLEPLSKVEVIAEESGRVAEVLVREGDKVEKGQLLLRLDTQDLEISRTQILAQLKSAQIDLRELLAQPTEVELRSKEAQYTEALLSLEEAKKTLARNEKLFAQGAVSQEELEASRNEVIRREKAFLVAQAELEETRKKPKPEDVERAKARVEEIEASLRSIERRISKAEIRSPLSGLVLVVNVEEGDFVSSGTSATGGTSPVVVADLSTMKVDVPVNEVDIPKVKVGQKARITLDAFPGKVFMGEVVSVAYQGRTTENVVTYDTTVHLPNPEGLLRAGMTANVEIIVEEKENVLLVPASALREEGGKSFVFVKNAQGQPERREVVLGVRSDTFVEVVEGVREGEEVFLTPPEGPQETPQTGQGSSSRSVQIRVGPGGPPPRR